MRTLIYSLLVVAIQIFSLPLFAEDSIPLPSTEVSYITHDDTEITMYHYPADGEYLLLWIESSYSMNDKTNQFAYSMADNGIEVWQVDYVEALFATRSSNFMRQLDAQYIADLITAAYKRTGKKIVLISRAYGSIPTMRGATLWQHKNPQQQYLLGAILFSPDFYKSIPELGLEPEYLPITSQTTLPMIILQGSRRGTAWQFPKLLNLLNQSNNNIYFKMMPGVSGIFYVNDLEPETLAQFERLPVEIPKMIRILEMSDNRQQPGKYIQPKDIKNSLPDIKLKPFKGNPTPSHFVLHDVYGKRYEFNNTANKVLAVNFWATWCPPCVEEIPSLNRLKVSMKDKPFELISINYGEPESIIKDFLNRVNVEFPVLLDQSKRVSAQWNVIAFPSTFIIGPDGKIHYGVNAAILWDSPEVIAKLNDLMK